MYSPLNRKTSAKFTSYKNIQEFSLERNIFLQFRAHYYMYVQWKRLIGRRLNGKSA